MVGTVMRHIQSEPPASRTAPKRTMAGSGAGDLSVISVAMPVGSLKDRPMDPGVDTTYGYTGPILLAVVGVPLVGNGLGGSS